MLGSVKQSLVFMVEFDIKKKMPSKLLSQLKRFKTGKSWDVIFYCFKDICPQEQWIPSHQIVKVTDIFQFKKLRDLVDLIKEPFYDRFKFQKLLLTKISEMNIDRKNKEEESQVTRRPGWWSGGFGGGGSGSCGFGSAGLPEWCP